MKKTVSVLLALICIFSLSITGVAASGPQPRWVDISLVDNTFKVSGQTGSITADVTLRTYP